MTLKEFLTWLQRGLDIRLFDVAGTPVTIATVAIVLGVVLAAWVISLVVQRALVRALKLRKVEDTGTVGVGRRLVHYLIMAIGLGIALQTVGINLGALFAAGAVFAVGLGFAMQNIAQNFVSGLILLVERSIKPGDVLRIDGRLVKVQVMGIRATIARTLDDEELIIPNSSIVQSTVTNYTLRDSLMRLRCTVGVLYGSDMRLVREVLEKTAAAIDWRVQDRAPVIFMREFADSAVVWEVSVWLDDPWREMPSRSKVNEAIWWALKDAGIVIAFPQVDVHFDPPVMESLETLRALRSA